jgi:SAM-dependent methyltransferase
LLDVGCGDGAFLVSARRDGWEVAGTEMNPSLARAAGIKVWTQFDEAAALAPFACVTAWHSLEHLRSPREVIRQAVGLLEPGGVLLVAVPNAEGLQARMYGSKWFHLDVPRHLYHFGPRSLTMLLEGAGLEVVRRVHLEVEIDMFGWTQSALNCISEEPNVFFNHLTGRPSKAGAALKWSHFAAGTLITAMAGPLTAIGALAGRGAVLVMTARKPRSNHGVARAA